MAHLNVIERDARGFFPNVAQPRPELSVKVGMARKPQPKNVISPSKAVTPFKERQHLNLDSFEYNRSGSDPGRVLIFNHETYDDSSLGYRQGSRRDVNEIIMSLQRVGLNIYEDDVMTDFTMDQVEHKLNEVLQDHQSLANANSFIVFFLTHGDSHDDLHVKDGLIKCSDIWTKFNQCPALEKKPKMFVFQACKGDFHSTIDGSHGSSKLIDPDTFTVKNLGKDMLIVYSTLESNVSFRNINSGTWFIQELCKNITAYGRRDDVINIITRTIKCVCGNYFIDEDEVQKQMPIFVTTLTRKFYLNRNKDRDLLLEVKKNQEEILDLLKKIIKE